MDRDRNGFRGHAVGWDVSTPPTTLEMNATAVQMVEAL